jgi:hypothetical protein
MEVKLQEKIKAAVEIDGSLSINFDNSLVYENIGNEEAFIYIKSSVDNKEIKIRFIKAQ